MRMRCETDAEQDRNGRKVERQHYTAAMVAALARRRTDWIVGPSLRGDGLRRVLAALLLAGGLSACAGGTSSTPDRPDGAPNAELATEAFDATVSSDSDEVVSLEPVTRPDEELYILELRLKSFVLSEGLFGYVDGSALLLPLSELALALEFPITVTPDTGRADGWFLREDRIFSLDMARREIVIDGRRGRFDPRFVELHADDIYVDTRILSRWFPVDIDFDLSNSLVKIRSREALPIESRLARKQVRAAIAGRRSVEEPQYERVDVPYRMFGWPFIDLNTEAGYRKQADGSEAFVSQYNGLITADLLKMSASMFVAGDEQDGLSQARLKLGRRDPDGEMLGPLKVTEFAVGDLSSPQITLIARNHFGRGAEISSFPLGRDGEFNRTTLIGDLPLGWDVELYRNEVLIDFQSARNDGRYEFVDVPLLFGVNLLRLEFFGPQGQTRRDTRRILVGEGQVPDGEFNFRLAANQHDTDLFPVNDDDTVTTDSALEGEGRFFAQAEYGLTPNLSLTGGVSSIPLVAGRRTYGIAGVKLSLGPTFSELDIVRDSQGGTAARLGAQITLPANLALLMEHSQFDDFISEDAEDSNGLLDSRSRLRLDGVIAAGALPRAPFSITASHESRDTGSEETTVGNRLSMAIRRLSVSNSLLWRDTEDTAGNDTETASGTLLVGGRLRRTSLRGDMQYEIAPESRVTSGGLTGDWLFATDFSGRLSVQRTFLSPSRTVYGAGVSRKFSGALVGFSAEYGSDDSASALVTVSFGLGRDPRTGSWNASAQPVADKGSVSARAFLDTNLNGAFDDGDEPLEGIRFATNRSLPRQTTDADGVAFITGLPGDEIVDVTLPPRSLEDPYWIARPEGVSIASRPGSVVIADFPVVTTGEVDGTIYLQSSGARREVADVVVQLVDDRGQVVQEAKSAYDGFYLFGSVLPGRYSVRIDPAQLARLDLTSTAPRAAVIGGDGTVVSGAEFTVYPRR